jgi:hypothetical protein
LVAVAPRISVAVVEVLEETKAVFCSKTLLRIPAEPGGLRKPLTADCMVDSRALNSLKAAIRVSFCEILFSRRSMGIRLTAIEASMMAAVSRPENEPVSSGEFPTKETVPCVPASGIALLLDPQISPRFA